MAGQVKRVLMVCTGNICRSPTMEGVLRSLAADRRWAVEVDSAGTEGWHAGEPPDPRTVAAARARGLRLEDLRARQVRSGDFTQFDLILAADLGHLRRLQSLIPRGARARLGLFLGQRELPDPYYGGPAGFEDVLDAVEARLGAWDGTLGFFLGD